MFLQNRNAFLVKNVALIPQFEAIQTLQFHFS